jgi:hypothetical protein
MPESEPSPLNDLLNGKSIDELSYGELGDICRRLYTKKQWTQEECDLFDTLVDRLMTWDMSMGPGRREMMRRAAAAQEAQQQQQALNDTPPMPEKAQDTN